MPDRNAQHAAAGARGGGRWRAALGTISPLALGPQIWRMRRDMPIVSGLVVVRSAIHGYGVVTQRPFARGEVVIHGEGILYAEDDVFDDTYALVLPTDDLPGMTGEHVYYDLVDQTRWINHSCEPNTEIESAMDPATGKPAAWWVATRDIAVGEELVYDYAFVGALAEPCGCGAATCRGLIVDSSAEELAAVPEHLRHHLRIAAPGLRAVG